LLFNLKQLQKGALPNVICTGGITHGIKLGKARWAIFFIRNLILPTTNAGIPEIQNLYGKMYGHFYQQTFILFGICKWKTDSTI